MDLHLTGKKALVTGASRGIGFAVAKCLLGEGALVRIAARPGERLENAAAALRAAGATDFAAYGVDLSLTEKRAELVAACGDVDILINCAGVIPRQTIEEMSEEAWRQAWELKLFGSIDLTRRYYARMKERRNGVIINVIGAAGLRPEYAFAAGSIANSALMSLTSALGGVSPDFNVRILGVNPGSVRTERTLERLQQNAKQRFGDESRWPELEQQAAKTQPFGHTQRPEQIAAIIAFLASDHAQYITGTTITVDGGASARTLPHRETNMTQITARDGVKLYAESSGPETGVPIVFVHELAGSCRSFDLQVAPCKSAWRCITFNARGYPPSDIPPGVESYSQGHAAADIGAIMDGFALKDAHIIGVSMGSASTLQYAIRHPERVRSITLTSIGSGSDLKPGEFAASMEVLAELALTKGMRALAEHYSATPTRYRLKEKNPAEYKNFIDQFAAGSALGITNTMRGVQSKRAPLYVHQERIAALNVPALVVLGEEDEPCVKPSHFLKEALPGARLEVVAKTGHCVNLEEPALYNRLVMGFIEEIEARRAR